VAAAVAAVRRFLDAESWAEGAQTLADDVEWWVAGSPELLPFSGTVRGRDAVVEWHTRLRGLFHYGEDQEVVSLSGDDEVALLLFRATVTALPTRRSFASEIARVFLVRDGRIVGVRSYFDTYAYVNALEERDLKD
jgi:ketosteroid isomerase-like protein